MRIDAHVHYVPPTVFEVLTNEADTFGLAFQGGETPRVRFPAEGDPRPIMRALYDLDQHRAYMDGQRLDQLILAPLLDLVGYSLTDDQGAAWSRLLNERMADAVCGRPWLAGLATVPMQAPSHASDELLYAVRGLGLRGAMIDTNVCGRGLGEPNLLPFWETADALDVPIVLHPFRVPAWERFEPFYLHNVIGYPVETTLAAAELIFSGLVHRFTRLRILLVHGGGFLPYQIGRLDRAFRAHEGNRRHGIDLPSTYLRRFHYDTLTHDADALRYLLDRVGSEKIVLGSDYPFGMGDPEPARVVETARLDATTQDAIFRDNAQRLFGLTRHDRGA